MSDSEEDSRTALIGAPRPRSYPSSTRNSGDNENRPAKRRRRNRSRANSDVTEFVPRGGAFSANPLDVDPDETSSSGSDLSDFSPNGATKATVNPHLGSTAPAINWNRGKKIEVRTTLGKRKAPAQPQSSERSKVQTREEVKDQKEDDKPMQSIGSRVNVNALWRSRSASASDGASDADKAKDTSQNGSEEDTSEDESVDMDSDDSDSGSLDSEEDDSILLNIGTKPEEGEDDYDPANLEVENGTANLTTNGQLPATVPASAPTPKKPSKSKEAAFQLFAQRYPTAPTSLVDLNKEDMDIQAQFIFWDRDINDIDMQLPVGCTECLQHGHLVDVCPTKECEHCGAWDQHNSSLCPSWRRCQKCRERGHQVGDCTAKLKCPSTEVPCDLCGLPHVESRCDNMFKLPIREALPQSNEIRVSVSCANCVSAAHLIGDCPSMKNPITTTFSLKGIDPSTIVDLNKNPKKRQEPIDYSRDGKPRKPQPRSPLSSSEDNLPRKGRKPPLPARGARGKPRGGSIRFGDSFTARSGPGPDKSRGGPAPGRGNGRPNFAPSNNHSGRPPPPPRGGGRGRGRGKPGRRGK